MIRNRNSNRISMLHGALPPIAIKILEGKIGYIKINSFESQYTDTINSVFNNYLPQLRKCKGLIIDIRGNRGGSDASWENIAYHLMLTSQFQRKGKNFSRIYVPTYKMWGEYDPQLKNYWLGTAMEEIKYSSYINELNDSLKFHQPVIVISGQSVGSSSESFLLLMKESARATVVGGPSVGGVGEPMFSPLPGGLSVMICAKKYVNPDGSQPNDTGILPDIKVEGDYNAYLKGRDNVLERAIEEVQKKIKKQFRI